MKNTEPEREPATDRLFAQPRDRVEDFVFDERVAAVFGDMISRSVPGYATIVAMAGILARRHALPDSRIYDLGCSLGAATAVMASSLGSGDYRFIAVDKAPAMVAQAGRQLADRGLHGIDLVCADIRDLVIDEASVVMLNFTLQFLPREDRPELLARIRRGMLPGGVLVLSEKIAGATPEEERLLTDLHHAFKQANGYSELEISQKRAALERVLLPETVEVHRQRLAEVGFSKVNLWFQCFNFVSFVASP